MNLLAKANAEHLERIATLFARSDVPFSINTQWCRYAYLNGIIDAQTATDAKGKKEEVCRFANPFIQLRLYNGLSRELFGDRRQIAVLEPLDDLSDVFDKSELDMPALMDRYKNYLERLKDKGIDPWKDQPRRTDLRLLEAVGHFHLYAWLKEALEDVCIVSPEFPTGNGKVDLRLQCDGKSGIGIIEVKSFKSIINTEKAKAQAARYASQLGLGSICLALFVPAGDDATLDRLSGRYVVDGVSVFVSAVGCT